LRVAYLGPEGTYSHAAAIAHFGAEVSLLPCTSIDDVFRFVEEGCAEEGIVPVENSTEGAVGRTLDKLLSTPLKIRGEVMLRIRHHLLRNTTGLEGIARVYSHAQSLAQCHAWLDRSLPRSSRVPVASNAEAARLAAQDAASAAIAGQRAAELYGLSVLAEGIEDSPHNTTRFFVLGAGDTAPTGRDKTSLVMSTPNRPGALLTMLRPLSRHGVSMTKLESRPSRQALWDYVFFVDVEGHARDARVARALADLGERAALLKVLGSYPVAGQAS